MKCLICDKKSQTKFCKKHLDFLNKGWIVNGWKKFDGRYLQVSIKTLDDMDKRLNQTVRRGKAHGKNINNLRSYYKNGKWNYKYLE